MPIRRDHRLTFGVLALGVGSYSLLQSVTVPTISLIQHEMDTSQSAASWILTSFLLSASVATPIVGRLGDSYGKKKMLVVSLTILSAGCLLAVLAPNIGVMIAARVVQGAGGGCLPLAFGIIRDELPSRLVATAISLTSSLLALGFGIGIVIAGPIVDLLGYHWLTLLPMMLSLAAAIGALLLVPESPVRSGERIPVLPAVLLAGWLSALLVGVSQAPQWGWASWQVATALGLALTLFAAWFQVERRQRVPLIDLRLMAQRGVWTANVVALLIGMAMYGSLGFFPQFNQTPDGAGYGFGATVTEAGHMLLPAAVMVFVCGLFAARLAARLGARLLIAAGSALAAVGILQAALAHDQRWEMYVAGGLTGLGSGLVFACLPNAVVAAVTPEQTGVATGVNSNLRTMGGALGSAMMTSLIGAHALPAGYPAERGYVLGFVLLASVAALAAMASMFVPASGAEGVDVTRGTLAGASDRRYGEPTLTDRPAGLNNGLHGGRPGRRP